MPSPLRIMQVITGTGVGGAENQLLRLVGGSSPGYRHTVVSLEPEGPLAEPLRRAGAEVVSLGLSPGPAALARGVPALAGLIRREKPDLVQSWMYHANLLAQLAALFAGRRPVVWGIRCTDMDPAQYGRSTRLVMSACARLSRLPRLVAANSKAGAKFHVAKGYPAGRMRVIPNGFDTETFSPDADLRAAARAELGLSDHYLLAGMVARFDPMKDFPCFLQAAEEVARKEPLARFVLLGKGVTAGNPALAQAGQGALKGRVFLLGRRENVPRWLNAMDLHVLSSAFGEGFSNAIGEAMSCGLPNLATGVGDNAFLIGDAGRTVPPARPQELAEAMLDLLGLDLPERKALGRKARERIMRDFSQEAMVAATESLYREVLAARTNPS